MAREARAHLFGTENEVCGIQGPIKRTMFQSVFIKYQITIIAERGGEQTGHTLRFWSRQWS